MSTTDPTQARPRASIYCRISQDREGLEVGVQRQEADCRELAERLGYEVTEDLVFIENDVSASTRSNKPRPQYEAMMSDARRGRFEAIIAYSNSRLTRRPLEVEDVIRLYEQTGVRVRTVVSGDDDLSTADGRMVARIKGNVDAAEAERMSERIKRARAQAVEDGRWRGGPRPYGFEPDGVTIREEEAEVIRYLTRQLLEGRSVRALVIELNERGVVSATGKKWASNNLREVVLRPRNAGLISTGQRSHGNFKIHGPAVWKPIVPEETWRAVETLLTNPERVTNGGRNSAMWLGSGLYRCGAQLDGHECGEVMYAARVGGTPSTPGPKRDIYRCSGRYAHMSIAQPATDNYVRQVVADTVRDPRVLAALSPKGADLAPDREELAVLRQRLKRTERDYDDDLIDARRYNAKKSKIEAEIGVVEQRMAQKVQRGTSSSILGAADPGQAFLNAPLDVQRAVLATVARVTILRTPPGGVGKRLTLERLGERVRFDSTTPSEVVAA